MPEFMHKCWAKLNGYFWLPCAVCGRMFGGHQAGYGGLIEKDGKTLIVCAAPLCNYEAGALNALNGHPVVVFSRTVPSRRST